LFSAISLADEGIIIEGDRITEKVVALAAD